MGVTYRGIPPERYWGERQHQIRLAVNEVLANLEAKLVVNTPVGVGGRLKGGWSFKPMLPGIDSASVGQSLNYFLPLELGRRPGKGVDQKGRESIALWARRKLGLSPQEANGLSFVLSRKYKLEGRPAVGFAGLAMPGDRPQSGEPANLEPVNGGIIFQAFAELDNRLSRLG